MTTADAERWNARYEGHDLAEPTRPVAVTDEVESAIAHRGRALDVACGAGGSALWLAARGLSVTAIDVSSRAVELTEAAAARAGLNDRVAARLVDLDDGLPTERDRFDVIVCQRFRATDLYDAFVDRLTPGGVAIITVLSQTGADQPGPFHAPAGELADTYDRPDVEVLRHSEGGGDESIVIRRTV